jgi:hypothetical protein
MTHDFEIMSQFQPLNNTAPGLVQEVVSYFEVAQTIHWSLLTLALVSSICIILLICFCSYLKCPDVISKILACCWNANCCLLKCLSQRIRDREVIRAHLSNDMQEESVQMLNMSNLQPVPQIENVSLNQSKTVFLPSAPNVSVDTAMSHNMSQDANIVPPLAASPPFIQPVYPSHCRHGYVSCFCLNGNQPCAGPVRQPPFH